MKKDKKKYIKNLLKIVIPIAVVVFVIQLFRIRLVEGGGVYVGRPILNSYAYTVYSDHVVLEEFQGEEQEEIVIPTEIWGKPVTIIGWECFDNCDNVKVIELHDNIEIIEGCAFYSCDNLQMVLGGSNIEKIGLQAFWSCERLEKVELGSNIIIIENRAFSKCERVKEIESQENIEIIGNCAFRESGLETFAFNKSVQIGSEAFFDTPWLYNQPGEFIIYGDGQLVFYNGTDDIVLIPHGTKILMGGCFDRTNATDIYIPKTVTKIEEFAFLDCENVNVYIPESVTRMGEEGGRYSIANSDAYITIITTQDSYAHQYAIEHDIPYEIVEPW